MVSEGSASSDPALFVLIFHQFALPPPGSFLYYQSLELLRNKSMKVKSRLWLHLLQDHSVLALDSPRDFHFQLQTCSLILDSQPLSQEACGALSLLISPYSCVTIHSTPGEGGAGGGTERSSWFPVLA